MTSTTSKPGQKTGSDGSLHSQYRRLCETPSDIHEHLPLFVAFCWELEATKVIELGTRSGVSTVGWLYGLERHQGHLWSVDLEGPPDLTHDRWTFVRGDDLNPAVVGVLPNDADIVFVDTSHTYEQTVAELNVYRWKLRDGGRFVLHDTELQHPLGVPRSDPYPVKRAIETVCSENGWTCEYRPNCYGLGIIQT